MTTAPYSATEALHGTIGRAILALTDMQAAFRSVEGFGRFATVDEAVDLLANTKGNIVTTGVGKSGIIAQKLSATLTSLNAPAFFVHPVDACHGDMGMMRSGDVLIALSYSGQTSELTAILRHASWLGVPVIGITSERDSELARASAKAIILPRVKEAWGRVPTASTTAMMVMGDCLAVGLAGKRGLTEEDFKRTHPGGAIGAAAQKG